MQRGKEQAVLSVHGDQGRRDLCCGLDKEKGFWEGMVLKVSQGGSREVSPSPWGTSRQVMQISVRDNVSLSDPASWCRDGLHRLPRFLVTLFHSLFYTAERPRVISPPAQAFPLSSQCWCVISPTTQLLDKECAHINETAGVRRAARLWHGLTPRTSVTKFLWK